MEELDKSVLGKMGEREHLEELGIDIKTFNGR
jgi:hypothetical protein